MILCFCENPGLVRSSLHFPKVGTGIFPRCPNTNVHPNPNFQCLGPPETYNLCCKILALPAFVGGKSTWIFTIWLSASLKLDGNEISKEVLILIWYYILLSVPLQHYLFFTCIEAGGSFSCVSSKSAFSHNNIPSLKKAEVTSQAWMCISSNPLFNKHTPVQLLGSSPVTCPY